MARLDGCGEDRMAGQMVGRMMGAVGRVVGWKDAWNLFENERMG